MGRIIGAVIAGYVIMFVVIFATFSLAYLILGVEGSFKPDSFEVTGLWNILSIILGLLAGIAGGWGAVRISDDPRTTLYLAGLIIVLGLAMAIPVLTHDDSNDPKVRTAELSNMEAMNQAKQPTWMALLNPFLGAFGVFGGARLGRKED